jgi:type III pantothenate kinase
MIIAIDVGNTTASFGFFQNKDLILRFSLPSSPRTTSEKCWSKLQTFLSPDMEIEGVICSSVVPYMTDVIRSFAKKYVKAPLKLVSANDNLGIIIRYRPPEKLGIDRLVNALAAKHLYSLPAIIIDLGTAIKIDAVNGKNEFLGGVILPGIELSASALHKNTSLLPKVELLVPEKILGTDTVSAIQSGLTYGYAGMLHFLIERIKEEGGIENSSVILTGGHAGIMEPLLCDIVTVTDATLTIKGLNCAYPLI